ncbi:hypothetical protein P170DRAFT_472747 [Aspergillus steynii IBT 23096]|uniref:LEA domain protein n=1 Tax=Aspergillus steynii IBT 23096 TaxID=1392250 RepID=A0A2I2GIZ5_9EURO|nr:uncharacterized protein P170DRAFT_472747 [Aspergillus steynii IBT 23096]PLB52855.1 hypothetical protein P170DRAFT_472747 [Aspergillus steynii IBT 23096]
MSSITRITPMAARLATRSSIRSPAVGLNLNRSISSTARLEKGPVEATKDTLKKADKAFSGAAVKGIEKGQEATGKIKNSASSVAGSAESKSEELKGEAEAAAGKGKGKAEETLGEAKGKTKEAYGEAKGKAKETLGS